MAELSDNANWFETDASNNKASPNGWPEGMMPSGVNDSARADKGALKRFWDRANPVQICTPASGVYTFTSGNLSYPTAYVKGETYSFIPGSASVGNDQFQINTLGAKPVYTPRPGGLNNFARLVANDILPSSPVHLTYDDTLNGGAGGFVLLNRYLPLANDGAGGVSVPGSVSVGGTLGVTGTANLGSLSVAADVGVGGAQGITYSAFTGGGSDNSQHRFRFGWTGSNLVVSVDSTGGLQLANTNQLAGYLPLGGGTLSGLLQVTTGTGTSISTSGEIISSHSLATGGYVWINGCQWSNNGGWMYTGSSVFSNSDIAAQGVLRCGGTGGPYWQSNSGYMYTANSLLSNGDIIAQNALRCGGTGGPYWQNNGGNMSTPQGLYVQGGVGGNVGIRVSQAVEADIGGTAFYAPNGNVVCLTCSANNFNNTSDAALKTGITVSPIGLDAVLGLAPRAFRWKAAPEKEELGLIAQEVETVLPQAVSTTEDDLHGPLLGINYAAVTTALVGAVQQLYDMMKKLEEVEEAK